MTRRIELLPNTKRGLDTIWADYNEINPKDSESERQAKMEQWIAKRLGTKLMKHYNQREWKVMVDIANQMVIVACDSICNYKGYHIKMNLKTITELEEAAVMAGGEILERHNLARGRKFNPAELESLARDARGSVIAPDATPEPV
jgi:hypothetical protein